MIDETIIAEAVQARVQASAPYSGFKVGCALLCATGSVYAGCNIESSSYGLTMCAERVTLFKALSEGERLFTRMAVVADTRVLTPPCGACRQLLWDYCSDLEIILANLSGDRLQTTIGALFPVPFGRPFLDGKS
ncbi:MAG: cytidine deaminase [Acidobacteriota bacterium]